MFLFFFILEVRIFSSKKYLVDVPTLVIGVDVTHPTMFEERSSVPSVAAVSDGDRTLWSDSSAAPECSDRLQSGSVAGGLRSECESPEEVQGIGGVPVGCGQRAFGAVLQDHSAEAESDHCLSRWRLRGTVSRGEKSRLGIDSRMCLWLQVLREEMQGIRTACLMLSSDYRPPITYVVVQKRHHARLFCQNMRDTIGRAKNVPPGTTVDTAVTSPDGFDFYLCSHFGIQVRF